MKTLRSEFDKWYDEMIPKLDALASIEANQPSLESSEYQNPIRGTKAFEEKKRMINNVLVKRRAKLYLNELKEQKRKSYIVPLTFGFIRDAPGPRTLLGEIENFVEKNY